MEHVLIGGNELFMTAGGKKSYTENLLYFFPFNKHMSDLR
mgnify:CR=1 FL=1